MSNVLSFPDQNLDININESGEMVITVKWTDELGPSASGKTTLISSSRGNKAIELPDGRKAYLGLNFYYK